MPRIDIIKRSNVIRTPRVQQLEGIFDVPPSEKAESGWTIDIPFNEKPWNIGLIVGPSGCGKSTILHELFGGDSLCGVIWEHDKSILDGFPVEMGIKEITGILSSVGFSSPPAWVRPFHTLSNGEQFRVSIARAIAESHDICRIDEFTSVVDRTVAQIGSAAISKTIRRSNKKLVVASCHYDIEDWLQPDWVYQPHKNHFEWRLLRRRPDIKLEIYKVHHSAWEYFKRYHYLSADINKAAQCFVAFHGGIPVAFHSYLHFMHNSLKKTKRGHRIVCIPDYQGVGIGNKLEEFSASNLKAIGYDYITATAHPARIAYSARSPLWKLIARQKISRNKGRTGKVGSVKHAGRSLFTFRYFGPPGEKNEAVRIGYG